MLSDLKIINPLELQNWDELILQHPDYSFFHTSAWAKVLMETYNYRPHYLMVEEDGVLKAALPLMEVNSWLTGNRAVSLPFSDYCVPLVTEGVNFNQLFDEMIKFCKEEKLKYLELRGWEEFLNKDVSSTHLLSHYLNLERKEDELFSTFRKGTKSSIKKSQREGVTVKIDNSLTSVEDFYKMNCVTRKKHGLPPQPLVFFKNLYKYIISKDLGFISLGQYKGKSVAGAIYLKFGKKMLYKYSASYPDYLYLNANNLVMWESLKYCIEKGFKELCFGITEPRNEGLRRYKLGWGTAEEVLNTYRYNITTNNFVSVKTKTAGLHNIFFNKAPLPALKIFGSLLYRHFG